MKQIFSAQQQICSAWNLLSPVRPSVFHAGESVKTVEHIGLCSFQYSPIPLVSARYVSSGNSNGLYKKSVCFPSAGRQPSNKSGWVVGKSSVNASKKYKIRLKLLLMTNRKLHVRCAFDCYQDRWPYMTLNCYKFDFLRISCDFVDLGGNN